MKKSIRMISLCLCFFVSICLFFPLNERVAAKEDTGIDNYSVNIYNKGGSPESFGNKVSLKKGENLIIKYTVESVECFDQEDMTQRHLNIVGTKSISSKIYPDTSLGYAVKNLLNGSPDSNYYDYKYITDTDYFQTDATYKIEFLSSGDNYKISVEKNKNKIFEFSIQYMPFYVISFYGYAFDLKMKDVCAYSGSKDMGISAWNSAQTIDYAEVVNTSIEHKGVNMSNDSIIDEKGTSIITSEKTGGYGDTNRIKIKTTHKSLELYLHLPEMSSYNPGDLVHITFRLKAEGNIKLYYDFNLSTWGNKKIDYGYQKGIWNFVNFDANVFERNGKNVVLLKFDNLDCEHFYISSATVSDDVFVVDNLFGGMEMYQLQGHGMLNMGYVCITPSQKVIVIDGGAKQDAEQLYDLLRQFTGKVDAWYISHYHSDHTGALLELLKYKDIRIENLYSDYRRINMDTFLDREIVEQIQGIEEAIKQHPEKVKNVITTRKGIIHNYGDGIVVKVLNDGYFNADSNYGNESTITYKMETKGEDILFLGDLGVYGDEYLKDPVYLEEVRKCRVVQMAHHGQNGVTDMYYEAIDDIKVCLYPALQWVYDASNGNGLGSATNLNTLKTRNLMRELGVRAIYTSVEGRIKLK